MTQRLRFNSFCHKGANAFLIQALCKISHTLSYDFPRHLLIKELERWQQNSSTALWNKAADVWLQYPNHLVDEIL